jgi:L-fuconate dehydratase
MHMGSRCAIDQQAELFRATIVGARIHHPFTLGGLNEVMIVLLLACKVWCAGLPPRGGVGLCEYVQHISLFDYICVSASLENRVIEYVDLHEQFVDPVVISNRHYMPPQKPGYSITMWPETLKQFEFPNGPAWK